MSSDNYFSSLICMRREVFENTYYAAKYKFNDVKMI